METCGSNLDFHNWFTRNHPSSFSNYKYTSDVDDDNEVKVSLLYGVIEIATRCLHEWIIFIQKGFNEAFHFDVHQ